MPEDIRTWITGLAARLAATDAEWVAESDEAVVFERRDTVYAYPARVAIVTDERNGSTAEQFVLDARQSLKVKTFGARTRGVLDISNMNRVEGPCGDYELWYSLSRSRRLPDLPVDDIGLQPDYFLDAGIPRWRWVEHVRGVLEANPGTKPK